MWFLSIDGEDSQSTVGTVDDDRHGMRCGQWVDLYRPGPDAGQRVKTGSGYHPWGRAYCIHDRCKALNDEATVQ